MLPPRERADGAAIAIGAARCMFQGLGKAVRIALLSPRQEMRGLRACASALLLAACAQLPPVEVPLAPDTGADAVVFDIDGTLTPSVLAVTEARPVAAEAVTAYSKKGYAVIYLSTRVPAFQSGLPDWLKQNGFPDGAIHVAQTTEERENAADYKSGILERYLKRGWHLAYAYGDSSTDFEAYAKAGIPTAHVFALKRRGENQCQDGVYQQCLDGWEQILPFVERQVPAVR